LRSTANAQADLERVVEQRNHAMKLEKEARKMIAEA
jgi:hypothetical protein